MRKFRRKKFLLIPVFILAFIALKSLAVMALWNGLVPDLFHGPEVTYWQSLGLVVLVKLLVGFPGGGKFGGRWGRGRFGHGGGPWGDMTPEEREEMRAHFKERMREKFGGRGGGRNGGRNSDSTEGDVQ